jgi:hypothetical protein
MVPVPRKIIHAELSDGEQSCIRNEQFDMLDSDYVVIEHETFG